MERVSTGFSWMDRVHDSRLLMYGLIGGGASLVDIALFVLLHELVGLPALAAHSVSIPAAAICSFVGNARFNFRTTDRLPRRAASFAVVVALGYAFGALVIWLVETYTSLGGTVGKLASLPLVFALQFALNSRISFRKHHAA